MRRWAGEARHPLFSLSLSPRSLTPLCRSPSIRFLCAIAPSETAWCSLYRGACCVCQRTRTHLLFQLFFRDVRRDLETDTVCYPFVSQSRCPADAVLSSAAAGTTLGEPHGERPGRSSLTALICPFADIWDAYDSPSASRQSAVFQKLSVCGGPDSLPGPGTGMCVLSCSHHRLGLVLTVHAGRTKAGCLAIALSPRHLVQRTVSVLTRPDTNIGTYVCVLGRPRVLLTRVICVV